MKVKEAIKQLGVKEDTFFGVLTDLRINLTGNEISQEEFEKVKSQVGRGQLPAPQLAPKPQLPQSGGSLIKSGNSAIETRKAALAAQQEAIELEMRQLEEDKKLLEVEELRKRARIEEVVDDTLGELEQEAQIKENIKLQYRQQEAIQKIQKIQERRERNGLLTPNQRAYRSLKAVPGVNLAFLEGTPVTDALAEYRQWEQQQEETKEALRIAREEFHQQNK